MHLPDLPAEPRNRRATWLAAALLAAVAAGCLARGMPWPNVDDLVFIGAGIDLARTGELVNHGMEAWLAAFHTGKFYVQLPFPVYSMALWFRVFGVHTASVLGFQWLWYVVGGWGLVRTLGRFGLALNVRLFLATLCLLSLLPYGCRPEAEAFALLLLGLALVDTAASFLRRVGALAVLGFGVMSYPLMATLAAPFGVALAGLTLPPGPAGRDRWRLLARVWTLPLVLAAAGVFLVFLAMIHGDLAAFLRVFNAHRLTRAGSAHPFADYFRMITSYHEAVLTLPVQGLLVAASGWVASRWRRVEPGACALVAACAVAAVGCIVLYAVKASPWIGLLAFFAAGAVVSTSGLQRWRGPGVLALAALYAASHALTLLDFTLREFPDPSAWQAARTAADRSGKRLMVNYSTARYVFDYRFPPDTRFADLTLSTDHRPNEIQVVTALSTSFDYVDPPPAYVEYPRLRVGGHEFQSIARCPDQPLVLP